MEITENMVGMELIITDVIISPENGLPCYRKLKTELIDIGHSDKIVNVEAVT